SSACPGSPGSTTERAGGATSPCPRREPGCPGRGRCRRRAWSGAPSGAIPTISSLLRASVAMAKLRTRLVTGALFVVAGLAFAPAALAGGPSLVIGATEDVAKQSDAALSQQEIVRAKAAGFTAIRMTQAWLPGQTEPPGGD